MAIHWKTSSIFFGLMLAESITFAVADDIPPTHPRNHFGNAFLLNKPQIVGGSEIEAKAYYSDEVSPQMNFSSPDGILSTSIEDLLSYFGYVNISASQLHASSSKELMELGAAEEILATRFFAPKITDVSEKPVPAPAGGYGWRKLVRFTAKAGSAADAAGMEGLYFLQNILEATVTGNPFDPDQNISKFNQAIVTRKTGTGPYTTDKQPVYFFTFGRLVKVDSNGKPIKINGAYEDDGAITYNLKATFDESDRDPETNSAPQDYFVPDSCRQCHGGGSRVKAKANYLDTDHWFDRVTPSYGLAGDEFKEEDFTAITQSPFGVLYDGGKDFSTPEFSAAFVVIRKLNEAIRTQNADIGGTNNFQLNAVTKWLDLHPVTVANSHVPPYKRGFGSEIWDENNERDRALLYYLNRYCYRCHSSLRYNVFDRAAVVQRVGDIEERLLDISAAENWMPQDRIFPGLTIDQGVPKATEDLEQFLIKLREID
jgi:hypothetical protein